MNAENKICAEARPIIQVNNLTKSFGKLEVLKGISETIYEGEVVSIIGPSGGGKSTFLRCLNLLETPGLRHHPVPKLQYHGSFCQRRPISSASGHGLPAF